MSKDKIRKQEYPFATCWLHDCHSTAMELVKFPDQKAFNLVWYCSEHARLLVKLNRGKVIFKLRPTMDGHLEARRYLPRNQKVR